ncbi:peptide ABC transporter substrate-binding protein [Priestia taiwanensis]|uniref:Peptide ABC transporter substrate-binding protein n=1 Tax=Priestia taiwanensis TaxID=1347902 RepID=A0A917ATM9_9BACI|nr:peptide ABC transporter substrate-binding protein [Priestia taiwanensis]MBM7364168.1 oligopeptide transport system substrate-binding protein [Priestia taiwanensis]GGE72155.1 peptide ABC transporter substrate-binding protein [Priestia taiwanensis]
MKKRLAMLFSLSLITSSFLAACSYGNDSADATTGGKKVLNIVEPSEIPTMDSGKAKDAASSLPLRNTMEGLYRVGEGDKIVDGMAEGEPTVSPDGLTYTFKIRDAKWSNGDTVTANDFEYAWKRAIDPATKSQYSFIMFDLKNAKKASKGEVGVDQVGVKALDEKTLEIQLEKPVPYFKNLLTFYTFLPVNKKAVEEHGDKYGTTADTLVFNGPFTMSEWKTTSYKLVKNDTYWDKDVVKLDEVNTQIIKEVSTAVNLYETNELDFARLTSEHVANYKEHAEFAVRQDPSVFYLRFNQKNDVLKNEKARKAIDLSYNKQGIAETILNNGSVPAKFFVPQNFAKDENGKDFRSLNGDLWTGTTEDAKKLWAEAKKELGKDTMKLEFLTSDTESAKKIAEFIKGDLEKNLAGLTVDIKQVPFKQKLDLEAKSDYQMTMVGWGPDYQDPMTFLDMFVKGHTQNNFNYDNPAYDELIKKAQNSNDNAERWAAMAEAEKMLDAEAVISPIYQRSTAYILKDKVKNLYMHAVGGEFSYKWVDLK